MKIVHQHIDGTVTTIDTDELQARAEKAEAALADMTRQRDEWRQQAGADGHRIYSENGLLAQLAEARRMYAVAAENLGRELAEAKQEAGFWRRGKNISDEKLAEARELLGRDLKTASDRNLLLEVENQRARGLLARWLETGSIAKKLKVSHETSAFLAARPDPACDCGGPHPPGIFDLPPHTSKCATRADPRPAPAAPVFVHPNPDSKPVCSCWEVGVLPNGQHEAGAQTARGLLERIARERETEDGVTWETEAAYKAFLGCHRLQNRLGDLLIGTATHGRKP